MTERVTFEAYLEDHMSSGFNKIEKTGMKAYGSIDREQDKLNKNSKVVERNIKSVQNDFNSLGNKGKRAFDKISRGVHDLKGDTRSTSHSIGRLERDLEELEEKRKITIDKRQLKSLNRDIEKTEKKLGTLRGLGRRRQSLMGGLGGMFAGVAVGGSMVSLGRNIIRVRSEFEKYRTVLANTLQSQEKAAIEFQKIQDFASTTPFSLRELTGSFIKLTNQGFKPSIEQMRNMGDLAASTGKGIDQLSEAILDAQMGEFERLKEFGIRAQKEGDKVKFTFKGVTKEVEYSEKAIRDYIVSLGDLNGVAGSTQKISETLGGQINNLGDSWDSLMNTMGKSSQNVFTGVISFTDKLIRNFESMFVSVKQIKREVALKNDEEQRKQAIEDVEFYKKKFLKEGLSPTKAENKAVSQAIGNWKRHIDIAQDKINFEKYHRLSQDFPSREKYQTKYENLKNELMLSGSDAASMNVEKLKEQVSDYKGYIKEIKSKFLGDEINNSESNADNSSNKPLESSNAEKAIASIQGDRRKTTHLTINIDKMLNNESINISDESQEETIEEFTDKLQTALQNVVNDTGEMSY